ncbi:glycine cleavage system transcriptional repressor, partial [Vibrio parahaemolyticus V-223/04]
SVPIAT